MLSLSASGSGSKAQGSWLGIFTWWDASSWLQLANNSLTSLLNIIHFFPPMVYIGLHFHPISLTVRTFRTKCLAPKKSSMQAACTCLNLSQCADLLICMTAESRNRKHCSCVFQDLVPIFKEGQSTSEGKIFRCPNCYLRVCINVVTVVGAYTDVRYDWLYYRLDEREDGGEIQNYLQEKTNQRTVPNIFISAYYPRLLL